MQPEPDNFAQMLGQLKRLPSADQKSVIAQLPLDQRLLLADMMSAKTPDLIKADEEANVYAHRYASLSSHIATICRAADQASDFEAEAKSRIKPVTRQALISALDELERRAAAQGEKPNGMSLRAMFMDFVFGKRAGA
jgi:hypothetical protein